MSYETDNSNHDAIKGLPPVEPPSGRFIAQLFLIPGLIVAVLVLIWLAGTYLVAEKRTPSYFLANLDNPNEDIRWRAASDLAQVLKRPESIELASNPAFALDLAERLHTNLAALIDEEKRLAERIAGLSEEAQYAEWQKLESKRNHVLFLISSLGAFTIPIGVPMLREIAVEADGPDIRETTLRRRQAVWALTNLGQNLSRYKDMPEVLQADVLAKLQEEMASEGPRGTWARTTYEYLTQKAPMGVDETLAKCASSEDAFLRLLVAHSLNFWEGPQVEPTLIRLSQDDGHGTRIATRVDLASPKQ